MQYGFGGSLRKNNTSCLLLRLYHPSVNWISIHLTPEWRPVGYTFVCMLISLLRLVNMYKKQTNFQVKVRRGRLINMQTEEQFTGRHFGLRFMACGLPLLNTVP